MDPLDPYYRPSSDPYALPGTDIRSLDRRTAAHAVQPADDSAPFDAEASPSIAAPEEIEEPIELCPEMLAAPPPKGLDFERGMSRFPPLTIGLILVLTAILIWEGIIGALDNPQQLMKAGALERAAVARGEYWRVISAMMLHGGPEHLIGNCIGLLMLGLAIEHAYGRRTAAAIYLAGGVVAALFCLALEAGRPTVGASGAIFGWWGAAVVFFYKHRRRLIERDIRVGFVLLAWAAWTVITGFTNPQISNFSHVGGFVCGALLALWLPTRLAGLRDPDDGPLPAAP